MSRSRTLSVALGDRPHVQGLLTGEDGVTGYQLDVATVEPIIGAYRRMARELAFDVCELAPTTYLMALEAGVPITGIPVFLDRRFHHGDLRCATGSGIAAPADLHGRRVGVRAWSVTTGVWVRGLLSEVHGVDLDAITWVTDDDDHLPIELPRNVERVTDGQTLQALLADGEIAAALSGNAGTGRAGAPRAGWAAGSTDEAGRLDAYPLFTDADVLDQRWHEQTGVYPLHAIVALRSELVDRDPGLPTALYRAFCTSKSRRLRADPGWDATPRLRSQREMIGDDPLPYGLDANRASVAALVRMCRNQGLIRGTDASPFAVGEYADG